ncbi:MAG: esterase [Cytophagaceae bacterium]|nr:esterase [Cytophagaceae bacterium]
MEERYFRYYSHHLGRDIEVLSYGHWGYPMVIFPTTMGRYFEAKDFKLIESISWHITNGVVKVYCVDSIDKDSWYAKHLHPSVRIYNHTLYDRFLTDEFVPFMQRECGSEKIAVAGCSFGGFHAANFAFRHPGQVSHLFSMGAAFNIRSFLDGYSDDNVYFNNPPDYLPNANDPALWQMKQIILGTAEHDFCKADNYRMSGILRQKNISHQLDDRPFGNHDWPVWRDMFPGYLSTI